MSSRWKAAQEKITAKDTIWQDPSSYDPLTHGPSYLPGPKTAKTAGLDSDVILATGYETTYDALPSVLVLLRALAAIHQTNHWVTRGPSAYADHLLFERLYDSVVEEIDQVAERAIGSGQGEGVANLRDQMTAVQRVVGMLYPEAREVLTGTECVEASIEAEGFFVRCLTDLTEKLKSAGMLSRGVDDLLAGISSKHEEHLYLLKQRIYDDWHA